MVITTSPSRASVENRLRQVANGLDEDRFDLAGDTQGARQRATVGSDDRLFAGGIDFAQHQRVDAAQYLDEILEAVARAGVAMRLKSQQQATTGESTARGGERRPHLDRVMTVVVDQVKEPPPGRPISP
jgi:hypothetical protein